jgi:hypothetical protein
VGECRGSNSGHVSLIHLAVVQQEVSSIACTSGSANPLGGDSLVLLTPTAGAHSTLTQGRCYTLGGWIRFRSLNGLPQVFSADLGVRRIWVPQFAGLPLRLHDSWLKPIVSVLWLRMRQYRSVCPAGEIPRRNRVLQMVRPTIRDQLRGSRVSGGSRRMPDSEIGDFL